MPPRRNAKKTSTASNVSVLSQLNGQTGLENNDELFEERLIQLYQNIETKSEKNSDALDELVFSAYTHTYEFIFKALCNQYQDNVREMHLIDCIKEPSESKSQNSSTKQQNASGSRSTRSVKQSTASVTNGGREQRGQSQMQNDDEFAERLGRLYNSIDSKSEKDLDELDKGFDSIYKRTNEVVFNTLCIQYENVSAFT
ncbi:hypothetical protein WR25_06657 isoform G [Diploscapter pachys]|uniref:Uncharacterized protein n=1 Tax=Diploscapter pachys TaxID=2018661 RepID=A0A2A2JUK9_9BILA|nr:hypothetical protein WR25_06657 isoform G [Diploscapter pachys]